MKKIIIAILYLVYTTYGFLFAVLYGGLIRVFDSIQDGFISFISSFLGVMSLTALFVVSLLWVLKNKCYHILLLLLRVSPAFSGLCFYISYPRRDFLEFLLLGGLLYVFTIPLWLCILMRRSSKSDG